MTAPTICGECGSNRYYAREFGRVRDDARFWQREAEKHAAEAARLKLQIEHDEHRDRTDVAWLQGKVVAQRRELKRLNDQLNIGRIRRGLDPLAEDIDASSVTRVEVGARHSDAAREQAQP